SPRREKQNPPNSCPAWSLEFLIRVHSCPYPAIAFGVGGSQASFLARCKSDEGGTPPCRASAEHFARRFYLKSGGVASESEAFTQSFPLSSLRQRSYHAATARFS